MTDHGTKIILYNLWEDDQGQVELDFETDRYVRTLSFHLMIICPRNFDSFCGDLLSTCKTFMSEFRLWPSSFGVVHIRVAKPAGDIWFIYLL